MDNYEETPVKKRTVSMLYLVSEPSKLILIFDIGLKVTITAEI